MGKTFQLLLLGLLSLGLFQIFSSQQPFPGTLAFAGDLPQKEALKIVVPNDVRGHWKSVDIAILDQQISSETTHTIEIGETYLVPGSTLSLKVSTFLPAFIMNGTQMTSASNELHNPAAYVIIKDNGEKVFSGWLFSLYPDAHAFKNPRYSFNLTGYTPNP